MSLNKLSQLSNNNVPRPTAGGVMGPPRVSMPSTSLAPEPHNSLPGLSTHSLGSNLSPKLSPMPSNPLGPKPSQPSSLMELPSKEGAEPKANRRVHGAAAAKLERASGRGSDSASSIGGIKAGSGKKGLAGLGGKFTGGGY